MGSVLVFLPQITILFAFILLLEDSGYLSRAALLLDNAMSRSGLSGRAFIPLLSSFACAVPAVMAARTIQDPRERLVTIAIAPMLTCSARLPIYALIIAAVIPDETVLGIFNLQGLTLFGLYLAGIVSAGLTAWVLKVLARKHGHVQQFPLDNGSIMNKLIVPWEKSVVPGCLFLLVMVMTVGAYVGIKEEGRVFNPVYQE